MENLKKDAKKMGAWLIDKVFDFIGWFLWTLYTVVADTIQGIIDFFISAFFLYISWGIILFVVVIVLYLITKALGAH
jgi:hypothetical protein